MDYHKLRYATRLLHQAVEQRRERSEALHKLAKAQAEAGHLDEAEKHYRRLLTQVGDRAAWWHELALLHRTQGRFQAAATSLLQALRVNASAADRHFEFGTVLQELTDPQAATREYLELIGGAVQRLPRDDGNPATSAPPDLLEQAAAATQGQTLGHLRMVQHRIPEALAAYEAAQQANPDDTTLAAPLASALMLTGEEGRAALLLGRAAYREQQYSRAVRKLRKAVALGAGSAGAYAELAAALNRTRRYAECIDVCKSGLSAHPREPGIYRELVWALGETNQTDEAIATAEAAATTLSTPGFLAATRYLSLPVVYETTDQIGRWRTRFSEGLRRLARETNLEAPDTLTQAREDLHPNFYLGYQGFNDLPLLREHGALIHRIMRASYPEWVRRPAMPPIEASGKIRIGYVFEGHTGIDPLFLAWMTERDPARCEIVGYQLGSQEDASTRLFESACDRFHRLPENLEAICPRVIGDQLHVLVYLYIGMGSLGSQLAGLSLAPVQCTTWGHPMTTGLPTVDYFISNELMEPEDAGEHYSETLVRLPGIGICPAPPFLPPLVKTRGDFGLPEDAVLYFSPQAPAKYLPDYDRVLLSIAQRVPNAMIVLTEPHAPEIGVTLRRRLQCAFAEAGLDSAKAVTFVPNQPYDDFLQLMRRCDVFLDTIGWSGGLTTLDAARCAIPIVTLQGELMRGRQSAGMLKQMGIVETTASILDHYVEIAVRLGCDAEWRQQMSRQLSERQDRLFDDRAWVPALDAFYRRAVTAFVPNPTG